MQNELTDKITRIIVFAGVPCGVILAHVSVTSVAPFSLGDNPAQAMQAVVILCATVAGVIGLGAAVRGLWRFIRCSRIANKGRDVLAPGEVGDYVYRGGHWIKTVRIDPSTSDEIPKPQTTQNPCEDAPRSTSGAPYGSPVDESGRPVTVKEHLDSARMMGEALKKCISDDVKALERKLQKQIERLDCTIVRHSKPDHVHWTPPGSLDDTPDTLPPGVRVYINCGWIKFVRTLSGAWWKHCGTNGGWVPGDVHGDATEIHGAEAREVYDDWRANH